MRKLKIINHIGNVIRKVLLGFGILFLVFLILSFTSLPFWGYYWLGTSKSEIIEKPDYIVLLGGGGMPSESNLMRAFFVYRAATQSPDSRIILSIPGNSNDPKSTARLVADELIHKGIDSSRIFYEELGTNTRSQALRLQQYNSENLTGKAILLVSSPEHMRRAVLVFQKDTSKIAFPVRFSELYC